jgi:hypothetical protein
MTTPLTPSEIAELRVRLSDDSGPRYEYTVIATPRDQWERLVSIAEDHARLMASLTATNSEHNLAVVERYALRAQVATLRKERERYDATVDQLRGIELSARDYRQKQADALRAQVATLTAELELLREAGATVLRGFDDGAFVRDTRGDGDPAWAIKLLPYLRALAALDSLDTHRADQSKEAKP